jgi:hypothetical protein
VSPKAGLATVAKRKIRVPGGNRTPDLQLAVTIPTKRLLYKKKIKYCCKAVRSNLGASWGCFH